MRLVRLTVSEGRLDRTLDVLRRENVDFVVTTADDGTTVVEFPLPTQAVDAVLSSVREADADPEYVVVTPVETADTEHMDDLERRFIEGEEESERVPAAEVRTTALDMTPGAPTYYSMTLLSVVVATTGLLLDAPALVVGSMVIAPQVGAAVTASVGLVLGHGRMVRDGLRAQALGLLAAVLGAAAFGWVLKSAAFVPPTIDVTVVEQVQSRISPGVLSMTVGIAAGAAGAIGLATSLPVSLVGVMVAAALVPAAAAVGIGIAWGYPGVAVGAGVLLAVNAASINLAGAVTFRLLGYGTAGSADRDADDGGRATVALALAGLLVVAGVAGGATLHHATTENAVNAEVSDVLDGPAYEDLSLSAVDVSFSVPEPVGTTPSVTVTVRRRDGEPYPLLADRLAAAIADRLDRPVAVVVQFVDRDRERVAAAVAAPRLHRHPAHRSPGRRPAAVRSRPWNAPTASVPTVHANRGGAVGGRQRKLQARRSGTTKHE